MARSKGQSLQNNDSKGTIGEMPVNEGSVHIHREGRIPATGLDLDTWIETLRQPRAAGKGSDRVHSLDLIIFFRKPP
jgi:hypothetical protein